MKSIHSIILMPQNPREDNSERIYLQPLTRYDIRPARLLPYGDRSVILCDGLHEELSRLSQRDLEPVIECALGYKHELLGETRVSKRRTTSRGNGDVL